MNDGGSPEPTPEPFNYSSIPPYEYPVSPIVDAVAPEQLKPKRKPELVQPFQRPHKPFSTQVSPVKPVVPEKQPVAVVMSHPETVTLPPTQDVVQQPEPAPEQPKNEPKRIPETISEKEQKQFTKQLGNNSPNNSETIRKGNSLKPDEPTPAVVGEGYKKKGRVGRQRKYEESGNRGEIPVKKVVIFRYLKGRHWPGMSQDMQEWYEKYYFTKPKKTGKAADYARHVKSYERGQRWIAEHEGREYQPGAVGHSGKVLTYRKRATS